MPFSVWTGINCFFNIQINVIYFTSLCKTVNDQVLLVPVTCKFEKKFSALGRKSTILKLACRERVNLGILNKYTKC
jgi:hypothetical protein